MEHVTTPIPNGPQHGGPQGANLEAYGDWVTIEVDPGPAAGAGTQPAAAEADLEIAYQLPDSRTAQELTTAEEELLDQLSESERAAAAALPAAAAGPAGAGAHATNAALAKLERQLSSLSAELKAVGQQLAELRARAESAPETAAEPAGEPAAAPPENAAAAGGVPPAITLEELESEAVPPAVAAEWVPQADPGDGGAALVGAAPPAPEAAPAVTVEPAAAEPPAPPAPAPIAAHPTVAPAAAAPAVTLEPAAAESQASSAPPAPVAPHPTVAPPAAQEAPGEAGGPGSIAVTVDPAPELPAAAFGQAAPAGQPAPGAGGAIPGAGISGEVRADVRSVLAYLDQLLDALPPDKVREFAQSEHFATYKKLFKEFGLDD